MIIISGKYKGKTLKTLDSKSLRPTTSRTKEAVFNIIRHNFFDITEKEFLKGYNILDLFCGSGAMSAEAFSHGADTSLLLDIDKLHLDLAKKNIQNIGETQNSKFLCADCTDIRSLVRNDEVFNLVFIDPPYQSDLINITLSNLAKSRLLKKEAIIVIEGHKKEDVVLPEEFKEVTTRTYGISKIIISILQ